MSETQGGGFHLDSMTLMGPVAILFFVLTLFLFRTWGSDVSLSPILWIGLPFAAFVVIFFVNLASQQVSCQRIHAGEALKGSAISAACVLLGIGVASISYCRIPVASVFAPLIAGEDLNVVQNKGVANARNGATKRCCTPRVSLEYVEKAFPDIAGCDYGFYVMFATMFGFVIGNSKATIC
jgi:hypothetical protein